MKLAFFDDFKLGVVAGDKVVDVCRLQDLADTACKNIRLCSDVTNTLSISSRERIMQTSTSGRRGAISSAPQLQLPCRAPRSAPAPCAEIRHRSVQSSHPYGRRNPGPGRGQAAR